MSFHSENKFVAEIRSLIRRISFLILTFSDVKVTIVLVVTPEWIFHINVKLIQCFVYFECTLLSSRGIL